MCFFVCDSTGRGLSEACVWLPLARDDLQGWLGGMAIQCGEFPEGFASATTEDGDSTD